MVESGKFSMFKHNMYKLVATSANFSQNSREKRETN